MSDASDQALRKKFTDIGVRYLARTQGELSELRALAERLRAGDRTALRDIELLAHRIRGSGAVFGFHAVSDAAGDIEMLAVETLRQSDADLAQVGAQAIRLLPVLTDAVQKAQQTDVAE